MQFIRRHRIFTTLFALVIAFSMIVGVSLVTYIFDHPGDSVQQNVAAWARNNHMGAVVDKLEEWLKADPPSTEAATELGLEINNGAGETVTSTTIATPTVPNPQNKLINNRSKPTAVTPVVAPALAGEGEWVSFAELRGEPIAYATSFRPFADFASVVASAVVIDQSKVTAGLFNGNELPGGTWNNGSRIMKAAVPSLLLAFNGGFRFEHHQGGYFTEGKMLKPLREDQATFAIDHAGFATVGVLGRDLFDDGSWKTLRQNLPPMLMNGEISLEEFRDTHWGNDYGKVIYTFRSATCLRNDGRLLFAVAGDVDIDMFADILKTLDCLTAMQLDINGTWPQATTYSGFGTTDRQGTVLDRRMKNVNRYLNKSAKDFFAFFDTATLPPGLVK
ncbi:MAG: hypothetical protein RIR69_1483 [Actinomycetota bacterium]